MASVAGITPALSGFDVHRARADFPILQQQVYGRPLIYLDSASTAQKPRAVLDAMTRFYVEDYANVHRAAYALSERATRAFEAVRGKVRQFINARADGEIIFVRGTTEAINLVAHSYARPRLGPGDEIVLSVMEHHSNIVPWQIACEERGAHLRVVSIDDDGALRLPEYERLLGPRTRLVAVAHVSNVLGTINPVRQIIATAHAHGVPVLLDGAQAVSHVSVDVQALDCDFFAFSGHKLYGPSGIGVLYGKADLLDAMPPYQGGGSMISAVTFEHTSYAQIPYKFEAGTPDIAGAVGLGAALDYVNALGLTAIASHESDQLAYATTRLSSIPRLRLIGTAADKVPVLSFVVDGVHPHDLATVLDREGIAIRAGHHCAQPLMHRFGIPATARASLGLYNTREDIDGLVTGLQRALAVFV